MAKAKKGWEKVRDEIRAAKTQKDDKAAAKALDVLSKDERRAFMVVCLHESPNPSAGLGGIQDKKVQELVEAAKKKLGDD